MLKIEFTDCGNPGNIQASQVSFFGNEVIYIPKTPMAGDVDLNGCVNLRDALILFKSINGTGDPLVGDAFTAADVIVTNVVDTADALEIFQVLAGVKPGPVEYIYPATSDCPSGMVDCGES